ncbi:MAG: short-chain dehydrogenase [Planctomycetes bacterium GWF2_42_9]|nr:MAG: short-chain dehydrogenase [Planctomycetes bacterium GWF2_42_9]
MHTVEMFSLKNKVILITGGAGLYGRCIFEALLECGGTVITASTSLDNAQKIVDEFKARGLDAHARYVDQAKHGSITKLKDEIESVFGGLDIFINNAVARPMKRYIDPLECWRTSMDINATGMFDIVREMSDLIEKRGGGSIVNIGSMQGMFGPDFSLYEGTEMDSPPDYHFHKGGMIALTKYLARKLGPKKIRVNCISPGGLYAGQNEKFVEKYNKKVPLGRLANNDDIKGVVVFLASEASSYITGENILMDGGLHA